MNGTGVPRGVRGLPHHLAALALFLAIVEAVTGALLSAHYLPTTREAHASVRELVARVPFGELLRALHARGADLLVVNAWLLVIAMAFAGRHRRARAAGWVAAVGLALASVYEAFLGSLLPWSTSSAAGAQMAVETAGLLPAIGSWLRRAMLGGDTHGSVTLARVSAVHASLLPGAAAVLYLALARDLRRSGDETEAPPAVRHFSTRVAALCTGASIVLVLLASEAPPGLAGPAESVVRGGAPPWYLGAPHVLLRSLPSAILGVPGGVVGVVGGAVAMAALLSLPWFDGRGGWRGRGFVVALGLLVLGGTVYARLP